VSPNTILSLILLALVGLVFLRRWMLNRRLRHYTAAEVAAKMKQQESILLLDVRTAGENRAGHIAGSLHIPLHELKRRMFELENYRDREIIVYCASGNRSVTATHLLDTNGFRAVNLRGGMLAWQTR